MSSPRWGSPTFASRQTPPSGRTHSPACDDQFERFAYVDSRTREAVICRLSDGFELMRLPSPNILSWYAQGEFQPRRRPTSACVTPCKASWVSPRSGISARRERVFREETRSDAFVFHPDGRHFFYAPAGTGLAVWDLELRRVLRRLPLDSPRTRHAACSTPRDAGWSPNDSSERDVRLLDVDTGRELGRWTGSVGRNTMALSGDGRLLASGDWNGSVFVWDMKKHSLASSLVGHTQYVGGCLFAPRSHLLATSSWDDTLRLWDASLGRPLVAMKQCADPRLLARRQIAGGAPR